MFRSFYDNFPVILYLLNLIIFKLDTIFDMFFHFIFLIFLSYLRKLQVNWNSKKNKLVITEPRLRRTHLTVRKPREQNQSPSNICPVRFQDCYSLQSLVLCFPFFPFSNGNTYYLSQFYPMYSTRSGRQITQNVQTGRDYHYYTLLRGPGL